MRMLLITTLATLPFAFGAGCPGAPEFEELGEGIGQEVSDVAPGIGDAIRTIGQAQLDVGRSIVDTGIGYYNANVNPRPTAGANKTTVYEGELVLLRVTINEELRSPNAETAEPTFLWRQIAGQPTITLEPDDLATVMFVAPEVATDARLTFQVTVTLSNGKTESSEIEVVILNKDHAANNPPIADAGEGRVAKSGGKVTLVGDASRDPEGGELTYLWEQVGEGPSVELMYADEAATTFMAPSVQEQTRLKFKLTVTDDVGNKDSSSVFVTVQP